MTNEFKLASDGNRQDEHGQCGRGSLQREQLENQGDTPWQQGQSAAKTLPAMWSTHELAQALGAQLGVGALLQ